MPQHYREDDELDGDELDGGDDEVAQEETGVGDDAYGRPGTALRPLHFQDGYQAAWERRPGQQVRANYDPTIRWGDKVVITSLPGQTQRITRDLLNVPQVAPQVFNVHFHAEILEIPQLGPPSRLFSSTIELVVGNGSQLTTIRKRYMYWPAFDGVLPPPGQPLDVNFELPLTNIRGRVSLQGTNVSAVYSLWLTPVVNIPPPAPPPRG